MTADRIRAVFRARMEALTHAAREVANADPHANDAQAIRAAYADLGASAASIHADARAALDAISMEPDAAAYVRDVAARAAQIVDLVAKGGA